MGIRHGRWALIAPAAILGMAMVPALASATSASAGYGHQVRLNCAGTHSYNCVDVYNPTAVGHGKYIGHDEPSLLFYSNQPGSGNNDLYYLRLPKDSPVMPRQNGTGGVYNFELHVAPWLGMAMCDSQSFPNYTHTCKADSDSNIFNSPDPSSPQYIGKHPGTAFMEMQFYPPGWAPWPAGISCAARDWCAALNIDSYSSNPAGKNLNTACADRVGLEYVNFAFVTKNGKSQAPANPLDATEATYTPNSKKDLFMRGGDVLAVALHDTSNGFQVQINDLTSHASGSMTASAANGFGQIKYAPTGKTCKEIPYDFHPMYSTSTPDTRVPWAAHSYNVAFSDEIGHFDYCGAVNVKTGVCTKPGPGEHKVDSDDYDCFAASQSLLVKINGCIAPDLDFDGPSYLPDWPGTGTPQHDAKYASQPLSFTTPVFNGSDHYSQVAFETDMPRFEYPDYGGKCNGATGAHCVNPPPGAKFYPIYSITKQSSGSPFRTACGSNGCGCFWSIGGAHIAGTTNNFGGTSVTEYSRNLLQLFYPSVNSSGKPAPEYKYEDFRNILSSNPC